MKKFSLMSLCTPAFIYLTLSLVALIIILVQNTQGKDDEICLGKYNCNVTTKFGMLIMNIIYVIFWTFILDLLCKNGYSTLSWFILLFPIILYVSMLIILVLYFST